jgi:outer membrane protein assembly factor BamD (BamD/ComL family)
MISTSAVKRLLVSIAVLFGFLATTPAEENLADLKPFREGCQALADERFETAVQQFQECWNLLQSKESGEAEKSFVIARLMESFVRNGSFSEAIEWFEKYPLLQPSPQTGLWLALACQNEERFGEAADFYNLFLSTATDVPAGILIDRAVCLSRSGKRDAAFDLVNGVVAPSTHEESYRLAQIASAAERYAQALTYLSIPRESEDAASLISLPETRLRIFLLSRNGRKREAVETTYKLIESAPDLKSARVAFLLLEQLASSGEPADLAAKLKSWLEGPESAAQDAAGLFQWLIPSYSADQIPNLEAYLNSSPPPELVTECRIRLASLGRDESIRDYNGAEELGPELNELIQFSKGMVEFRAKNFKAAARQFLEMADARKGRDRNRYLYNAAIAELEEDDVAAFDAQEMEIAAKNPRSPLLPNLTYLGGIYYAGKGDPRAFERLNSFINSNPDHELNVEARLGLAELQLNQAPARPNAAREILEGLSVRALTLAQSERLDYTHIWVELTGNVTSDAIKRAEKFISDWPSSDYLPEVSMILATEYYRRKNLKLAAKYFTIVAERFPGSTYAESARFFKAKCSPVNDNTIEEWRTIAGAGGRLAIPAELELGHLFLSVDRFTEAKAEFQRILERPDLEDDITYATMADLAFSSYLEALANGKNPEMLEDAANQFAAVSRIEAAKPYLRFNAAVRRGKCLEALGKETVALEIYQSIVDETTHSPESLSNELPPQETEWVFRAGFAAIDILTSQEKWLEAIHVADALSRKNGSRASEATGLAERLRLKHWIWD